MRDTAKVAKRYSLGENPFKLVEWVVWPVLFLAGLYLLSPGFDLTNAEGTNSALLRTVASDGAFYVYGGIIFLTGALGTLGLWLNKPRWRKWAAHVVFFVFLYFTMLRITISGVTNLGWITYFVNTMFMMGVILRLRWEETQ